MINFRNINGRFSLSGHFEHLERDVRFLARQEIVGVLDLAFEPDNDWLVPSKAPIAEALAFARIDYVAIPMWDGPGNGDLEALYGRGRDVISVWAARYPEGRILVKCRAGMSRSVSMLTNFLCATENIGYGEALDTVSHVGDVMLHPMFEEHLDRRYPDPLTATTS